VDAVSRKDFWDNLHQLQRKGITILVSTAYMDEASRCDRLAMLQQGKMLTIDIPSKIIAGYDKKLYAIGSDHIHELLSDLRQWPPVKEAFPFGDRIHFYTQEPLPDPATLIDYFSGRGHGHIVLEEILPTLEDCFMNLMEKE
jgi:ABC-type multidrug transport system ATPase subunit